MKTSMIAMALGAAGLLTIQATEQVSIESLLNEMVDRGGLARFPETDFRLKQESSYNRASKTPNEPKGWFTNRDYNSNEKDRNFIRIEGNEDQKEWVLMDHEGSGALVRTWMPFEKANNPDTDVQIRIYLDGATTPVLEGNMLGLFNGTGLIPFPLAHKSLRSAVSFFPIPYASRCKITTTEKPFFYQFTFREYPDGTPVKTFSMEEFDKMKPLTEEVSKKLLEPVVTSTNDSTSATLNLDSKQSETIELPKGSAAVRSLSIKLSDLQDPATMRSVVIKARFDDKETIWCPIGDFFGTGIGLHPFQGYFRSVSEDGTMTCRWVMPYRDSGSLSLVNLGDKPVKIEVEAATSDWVWDDRSMYFHSNWRRQFPVATRPYSDWNYITTKGRGVYVGDTLTVMNPVERWWGEGDEKIWVDGESFPSIFGTGTEDYYAYSWGGVSTDFYEHPFHAQPRSNRYNKLNRKGQSKEKNTQGYSTETRTRALDTMPFGSSLQLDMEVWSWSECEMEYAVATYWYGFGDTTSNRKPDPTGATAPLTWPASPSPTEVPDSTTPSPKASP